MIRQIRRNIELAGGACVTIVAATKTRSPEEINPLLDAGIDIIGENRAQELIEKLPALNPQFRRHFIGQLQKNKVKYIASCVDMIQSVDRASLVDEIQRQMAAIARVMPILIEVSPADEAQKGGVSLDELDALVKHCKAQMNIRLEGLMAVMPIGDTAVIRPHMRRVKDAFDALKKTESGMKYLSMGMSEDYITAVEEGANMVRLGSAIFGARG